MKRFLTLLSALAVVTPLMAQTEEVVEPIVESAPLGQTILTIFAGVVFLAASLAMLAHMIYDNFIRKSYNENRKVSDFVSLRSAAQMPQASTEEEIAHINSRLDEIIAAWGTIPGNDGEPVPYPLKKAGVKLACEVMAEAEATMPTDEATVKRLNGLAMILNSALQRTFNGSKALIIISIIIGAIAAFTTKTAAPAIYIGVGLLVYWLASRTANFVLIRKEIKNGGVKQSFLSRIIGGLFAGVAAAKTYKTITTYSDGSQTTDVDNSETWISLAITLVVLLLLASLIWFFSLINYLRNYVFYF